MYKMIHPVKCLLEDADDGEDDDAVGEQHDDDVYIYIYIFHFFEYMW